MGQKYTIERYPRQYYISQALLRNKVFLKDISDLQKQHFNITAAVNLLKKYVGAECRDKGYISFVNVLLNKPKGALPEYGNGLYSIKTIRDLGTSSVVRFKADIEPGVYIKIFPYTTGVDISKNWSTIEKSIIQSRRLEPETFPWPIAGKQRSHKPKVIVDVVELNFKLKKKYGIHKTDGRRKADKHNVAKEVGNKLGYGLTRVKEIIKEFDWLEKYFVAPL